MDPQVIAGRYEVVRAIGRGGMGTVWLCRDNVLGREVAVKQVGALPGEAAMAQRAMREARIAASLNHPNAVAVYDIVDHDGDHWLVMEYVDGRSLAEVIQEDGSVPPNRVATIGAAVASALSRAHERGIVHRDIKPGNILIGRNGRPKISDFGIARGHADDQLTQTGFVTGTPGYLSPELVRGGDPTPASDVWALGATLYTAVEGQAPFAANANPLATLQAIATQAPRPMERAGRLGGAIAAMMDPNPQARWDMATASDQLDRIAKGDTTIALSQQAGATRVLPVPVADTEHITPVPATAGGAAAAYPRSPREDERDRKPWAWVIAALVVAALLAALWAFTTDRTAKTPDAGPTTAPTQGGTTPEPTTPEPTTPTTTTTTTRPTPTTTTTTTQAPQRDAAAMERFVRGYFNDVTKQNRRDETFALLTPSMQEAAGGREGYEEFWSGIKSVDVREIRADPATGAVLVGLTYKTDEEDSRETHQIGLVDEGRSFLINSDTKIG